MVIKYRKLDNRKKERLTIRIDQITFNYIKQISMDKNKCIAETIRNLLSNGLEKEEIK